MEINKKSGPKTARYRKILRIACVFVFLLCGTAGTGRAAPQAQFTLQLTGKTLREAFDAIEQKSDYLFFFLDKTIDTSQKIDLSVKNQSIGSVLDQLFRGTGLSYYIDKRQIVVSRKAENQPASRKKLLTGLITDAEGNPIIGATVRIKGTTNGVTSDTEGRYAIQVNEGDVLEFRYMGYNSEEKTVKKENTINIRMLESTVGLEDVVVVGYGQQKKSSVVASINSIGAKELSITQRNLKNSIAGQIAGVIAIQRSGEPGNDDASFWIRGQSSYVGGTSPLVLVDGVPRSMSDIDVDEIESFTVLKDAAATAVYGAEGANGVVLITSKRGKVQKTVMNFNAQYSIVSPTRMPELMNSYDYLALYNEALWNDQGNPTSKFSPETPDGVLEKYRTGADPDLYPNVNWMDLLNSHSHNERYTLSFRGGSEKTRFFVSGAYYSENGIFKSNPIEQYDANIGLQRFNLRSNIDMRLTKTTNLSVDMSGQYLKRNAPGRSSDDLFSALTLFPTHLIPMYYSDGTSSDHSLAAEGRYNPYNLLNQSGYTKQWKAFIQSKVTLEQQLDFFTKGLSVKGSISFDADFTSTMKRAKTAHTFYATGRDENGQLVKQTINDGSALANPTYSASGGTKKIYMEASLNYSRRFVEKHDVNGMVLYMQKETQYQNQSDGLKLLPYRKQSLVARASYGFDNRYMLEASFGATGSENFASGHRWGIFPAVGGAWYISHEKFMQPVAETLSKLKLRASYGITGNDNLGSGDRFPYRESLSTGDSGYNFGLTPGTNGGATNSPGNGITEDVFPALGLSWEKETKLNLGLDLGLFNGRVDLTVDWFSNRRSNILIQRVTIPTATGFRKNPYQNFGITTNKGLDGSLLLKQRAGQVNLSFRGNFTYARNQVTERDEIPQIYDWLNATGQRIGQPKIYLAEGLYTPDDFLITTDPETGAQNFELRPELPKPSANVAPGDIKYKDLNGDQLIDSYDKTYNNPYYSTNPQIVYGFGLNADYKGFFAGIFFQGVAQASTNLLTKVANFVPFYNGKDSSSGRVEALNRWMASDPYNQNVLFPRMHPGKFTHNLEESTWWYRNAGFLRLKNVEFGYEFSKDLIRNLKMQNLRLYVQGTNLAVWDHIKYWDPEIGSSNSGARYPICGTWTIGMEVTF